MNNKKRLKSIFDSLEQSLNNNMAIRIEHNLEDGKYREYLIKEILDKVVPSKYSVTNGFVIDSDNNISNEMDIIIYDKSYVPPFFDETYTVVPIEAVIAVVQVKTTLTREDLKGSVENLNSINELNCKTGGKIISADVSKGIIEEKRFIMPYKILISYRSVIAKTESFENEMKDLDMLYIVDEEGKLIIKHRDETKAVVNESRQSLLEAQEKYSIEEVTNSRLCYFTLNLLEKMKLINNSIIINYSEYIKGAE